MLNIAGLGPGDPGSITKTTYDLLRSSRVILRTRIHPTVKTLEEWGIPFISLDYVYEEQESFEAVYQTLVREVLTRCRETPEDITYLVPGNPLMAEKSVRELIKLAEQEGLEFRVHPAVSFIDTIMTSLRRDPVQGLLVLDSADLKDRLISNETDTIIAQVYNRRVASEVKIALSDYLADEAEIIFVRNAGMEGEEDIRRIPLWTLDRQEPIDHLTSVYIEKEQVRPGFNSFRSTINTLREPGGCPWDREQTHESLTRYLIEEAYEVTDAITKGSMDEVKEELGDVLLQVMLHSRIAQENGDFTINDVIRGIDAKMVSRHPHVFGGVEVSDTHDVLVNWEEIKKTEKGLGMEKRLEALPRSIPASMRTVEVAKKASTYGHAKRQREEILAELRKLLSGEGPQSTTEVADLGFYSALLADAMGLQPEGILQQRVDEEIQFLIMHDKIQK